MVVHTEESLFVSLVHSIVFVKLFIHYLKAQQDNFVVLEFLALVTV